MKIMREEVEVMLSKPENKELAEHFNSKGTTYKEMIIEIAIRLFETLESVERLEEYLNLYDDMKKSPTLNLGRDALAI